MISKSTVKNTAIATFSAIVSLSVAVIGLFQAYGNFTSAKLGGVNLKFDNFIRFSCLGFVLGFICLVVCLCLSYKIAKFIALFLSLCFIGVHIYIITVSNTEKDTIVNGVKYIFEDKDYEIKSMEIENQLECCGWDSVFEPQHTCNFTTICHSKIQNLANRTSIELSIFFSIAAIFMVISLVLIIFLIKGLYGKKNEYIQIQQADGAELSYL